jgi:MFS family permease
VGRAPELRRARPRLVTPAFLLVSASTFLSFVALGALLPVLPRFAEGPLDAGAVVVGLSVGIASVSAVASQPFLGRLADRVGRRPLVVGGPVALAAVTALYVAADSIAPLLALRLVAGVAEGMILVGGLSAVSDLTPEERRGEAMSYFTLALYGGLALGPLFGELVLSETHYDRVWLVAALVAGLGALAAVPTAETRPAGAPGVAGKILHRAALLPGVVLLAALLGFGAFNAFIALYALELGLAGGGPLFLLFSAIVVGVRLFGARLPDVLGAQRAVRTALVVLVCGYLLIAAAPGPAVLFVGVAVYAFGQSLVYPALVTLAVRRAPVSERSSVIGTFSAFIDLAIVGGAGVLGGVVAVAGYEGAFFAAAAIAALGVVPLALLSRSIAATPSAGPGASSMNA